MTTRWDGLLLDCTPGHAGRQRRAVRRDRARRARLEGRRDHAMPARRTRCRARRSARRARRIGAAARWSRRGSSTAIPTSSSAATAPTNSSSACDGASYEDIARAGGGIMSTRARDARRRRGRAARAIAAARARAAGRRRDDDRDQVRLRPRPRQRTQDAARRAPHRRRARHRRAHDAARRACAAAGIRRPRATPTSTHVCDDILPAIAREGLADAVDAFCERIAFTPAQTRRVFETRARARPAGQAARRPAVRPRRRRAGRRIRRAVRPIISNTPSEAGVRAMAAAGTVAVLLPGAFYALRETKLPPIDALRAARRADRDRDRLNPGTSPLLSLRLAMSMACTLFRLTPEEALRGATVQCGARARPRRSRHARSRPARRLRASGMPSARPICATGSAATLRAACIARAARPRPCSRKRNARKSTDRDAA